MSNSVDVVEGVQSLTYDIASQCLRLAPQKLLLVNSNISATDVLHDACLPNVSFLLYDYNTDTFESLLQKIRDLRIPSFDEVGFIFHGAESIYTFKLLDSQTTASIIINNEQPDISSNMFNNITMSGNTTMERTGAEVEGERLNSVGAKRRNYSVSTYGVESLAFDFGSGSLQSLNDIMTMPCNIVINDMSYVMMPGNIIMSDISYNMITTGNIIMSDMSYNMITTGNIIINDMSCNMPGNIMTDISYNMPSDVSNNTIIYCGMTRNIIPNITHISCDISNTLETWGEMTDFLSQLKSIYAVNTIDFFACDFYNSGWKEILNAMEVYLDVHIRASADTTGNMANGGNWIMESDNTNIQSIYFNDKIADYQFTFTRTTPTNFKFLYNSVSTDFVNVFDSSVIYGTGRGYVTNGADLGAIFTPRSNSNGYDNGKTMTTNYKINGIDISTYFALNCFTTSFDANQYSVTSSAAYNRIISFTPTGTNLGSPWNYFMFTKPISNAKVMIVAGGGRGGDGGQYWGGAGGGGGGNIVVGTMNIAANINLYVQVGAGGGSSESGNTRWGNGGASSLSVGNIIGTSTTSVQATGGGDGADHYYTVVGVAGGSGGGGSGAYGDRAGGGAVGGNFAGTLFTPLNDGNWAGNGGIAFDNAGCGGGGGGAWQNAGNSATSTGGGEGGQGATWLDTGLYYGGGGGGGCGSNNYNPTMIANYRNMGGGGIGRTYIINNQWSGPETGINYTGGGGGGAPWNGSTAGVAGGHGIIRIAFNL